MRRRFTCALTLVAIRTAIHCSLLPLRIGKFLQRLPIFVLVVGGLYFWLGSFGGEMHLIQGAIPYFVGICLVPMFGLLYFPMRWMDVPVMVGGCATNLLIFMLYYCV